VLDHIAGLSGRPSGRVRVVASRLAARMILAPRLAQFARDYPDVTVDVTTTEESRVDLVRDGFDAGIHLGEFVERYMVAVRVSSEQRAAIVGAPSYLASHPTPRSPRDLTAHKCLNFRHGSSGVYRWEFDKGRQSLSVAVTGPIVVDDVDVLIRAAIDGAGLAFTLEDHVAPHLTNASTRGAAHRGAAVHEVTVNTSIRLQLPERSRLVREPYCTTRESKPRTSMACLIARSSR
jgi:DNA-binding transcriptional LysR family regulator